ILVARSENLYVSGDAAVRKITPGGTVTTFAGKAGERGIRDGDTSIARFLNPGSLALDGRGNIYVHDRSQNNLRMIGSSATSILVTYENGRPKSTYLGEVITLAGRLTPGDGLAATRFDTGGSAVDVAGNRYLLDKRSKTLRKTTLAGESITYTRAAMRLGGPEAVAVDGKGNVYVADTSKHVIRQITPDAEVVRLAGMDEMHGGADGTGLAARFNSPSGIAVDSAGNLFVADSQNHAIRKIAPGGVVTTFAGRVGVVGSSDGSGAAARFANPRGIAIDGSGNLYVADTYNNSLRKITPEGIVSTLVGKLPGFTRPQSIAIDEQGNLYVAHTDDHIVRRITPDGVMSTVAGVFGQSGFTPGALPGLLGSPRGVAVAGRSLYITLYNGVAVVDLP
ncbi:MAG: hypothetical protein OEW21_15525, partial [Betaproteobacteria bacterium]|nr:hypothetical protein [Betaproteobacteria bacterium]